MESAVESAARSGPWVALGARSATLGASSGMPVRATDATLPDQLANWSRALPLVSYGSSASLAAASMAERACRRSPLRESPQAKPIVRRSDVRVRAGDRKMRHSDRAVRGSSGSETNRRGHAPFRARRSQSIVPTWRCAAKAGRGPGEMRVDAGLRLHQQLRGRLAWFATGSARASEPVHDALRNPRGTRETLRNRQPIGRALAEFLHDPCETVSTP